jgi:hypothetical protein
MASPNNIAELPRIKPGRRGALSQIIEMQRLLFSDARDPKTTPSARAQVVRAWDSLEERKRIIRGHFKPGDVRLGDLAPDRIRRNVKRFAAANKRTLRQLPALEQCIAIPAQVKPAAKATTGETEPEADERASPEKPAGER